MKTTTGVELMTFIKDMEMLYSHDQNKVSPLASTFQMVDCDISGVIKRAFCCPIRVYMEGY